MYLQSFEKNDFYAPYAYVFRKWNIGELRLHQCKTVNSFHNSLLQPENIICETSKSTNIKLIDFGLATKLNPAEIAKVTTATAEFAAPEIAEIEPVGFYTDMWAVGVLAYVL